MYCHLNVKTGSRSTGQSAAAKYDYISRAGRYAEARQDEVVHVESGCMPAFAASDAREYWAAADSHERSNGRLFRSLTAALPNSLDADGRLKLARTFAAHVTAGEMPYTLALHAGLSREPGTPDNPHLHLVFSERVNDGVERAAELWFRRAAPAGKDPASGGARKSERTKPREWLEETRKSWAEEMNLAFGRGRRGRPGDGREPRRATGAGEGGRRPGGAGTTSPQPAVRAHRAGGETPLGGSAGGAEARPVRRVRTSGGFCAGGPAGARAGRGGSRRGEAEDREARREDRGARSAAAESRGSGPAEEGGRREARRARAPQGGGSPAPQGRPPRGAKPSAATKAKWEEKQKSREAALRLWPGGMELYLAHLADIDPKWNVGGNTVTAPRNIEAALDAAESDARRLERLRAVLTDANAAARYQRQLDTGRRSGSRRRISTTLSRRPKGCRSASPVCGSCSPRPAVTRRFSPSSMIGTRPGGAQRFRSTSTGRLMPPSGAGTDTRRPVGSTG